MKNPNKTYRIYKKLKVFYRKTQGNFAKTQLSANNSELVRNAEFCPPKKPAVIRFVSRHEGEPRKALQTTDCGRKEDLESCRRVAKAVSRNGKLTTILLPTALLYTPLL